MERKLIFGMMQFGSASRIRTAEEKLSAYLTVAETLLAREEGERSDRWKKVGRRLGLAFTEQEEVVGLCQALYNIRRFPVHFGHRTLRGRGVVTPAHVSQAQVLAYFAIFIALEHSDGVTTQDDFIQALDTTLADRGMTPGRPVGESTRVET